MRSAPLSERGRKTLATVIANPTMATAADMTGATWPAWSSPLVTSVIANHALATTVTERPAATAIHRFMVGTIRRLVPPGAKITQLQNQTLGPSDSGRRRRTIRRSSLRRQPPRDLPRTLQRTKPTYAHGAWRRRDYGRAPTPPITRSAGAHQQWEQRCSEQIEQDRRGSGTRKATAATRSTPTTCRFPPVSPHESVICRLWPTRGGILAS